MFLTIKRKISLFSVISILAAIGIILPLFTIARELFTPANDTWRHIQTYLLFDYIKNSLILVFFTAILSGFIGFTSAYIVTFYEFKGRKLLSWMLILPLAVPSYIAAYIYADSVSFTGTIGRLFQSIGVGSINIMNMTGAIIIFSFTLYPYVYMLVRSNFKKQSSVYIENATLLSTSKFHVFRCIILPLTRPALVAGTLLVVLETLNDYGLVKYFGVRVFSYAIFDAWFRLGDVISAIRISAVVLVVVFIIITLERILRGKRQYTASVKSKPQQRKLVTKIARLGIYTWLLLILTIGFLYPFIEIVLNTITTYHDLVSEKLLYIIINTVTLALLATTLTLIIALMLTNFSRTEPSPFSRALLKITTLGYAIPGAVIAVSVLIFFTDLDRLLYPFYNLVLENPKTLILSTSLTILVFAYILRFMTIAFNSVESSYDKIGLRYTEASYVLGSSKLKTLITVDLPLIKPGLITAFIIVFIDIIKELPLTLILRPTNYNTLATNVYTYANDEMIHEASAPALVLIIISGLLIYYLTHRKSKRGV